MEKPEINLKDLPKEINGDRITLKQLNSTFENAELLFTTVDENREYLREWMDWVDPYTKAEDAYNYFKKNEERLANNENVSYDIFLGDVYLGRVSCFGIKNGIGEVGYWLSQKYTNNGYMTEAVNLLEKELFAIGMNRIVIKCDPENLSSSGVAKKAGYKFEALLHADEYSNFKQGYIDIEVYYKLKSDYEG